MGVYFGKYKMTPGIITDGLIMHIDMASNFSYRFPPTINDLSGRNANATMSGSNYTSDKGGGLIMNAGVQANAVAASSNNIIVQNSLTMAFWVWFVDKGGTGGIFTLNNGGTGFFFRGGLDDFGPRIQVASANREVSGTNVWAINNYWYFALTYDGTNLKFYRNGSQINATESSGGTYVNSGVATNYVFGQNAAGSSAPAGHRIYMAHIYNRALSDAEVSQNFNGTRSRFGV